MSDTKQIFYAVMAIIGVCATWYFNLQAMALDPNFSFASFIRDNYVNPSSASIANDIAVILLVFFFWNSFRGKKFILLLLGQDAKKKKKNSTLNGDQTTLS